MPAVIILKLLLARSPKMRKQYHLRKSDKGLLAWDVHHLIELTQGIEPRLILLASIREIDEAYWFDADDSALTCRDLIEHMRLVEATDLAYPIILCADGRIMDGMHRVIKALLQGQSQIMAVQFLETPEPNYIDIHPSNLPYDG
jgi:hypothetical protein